MSTQSSAGMTLAEVQRQMAAAVMMPLTANEEMRAENADGRAMAEVAAEFIAPNSQLSAFERLEIYNKQYWFRVLDALAEDFRVLRSLLGWNAFERLAIAYLTVHPSRSFSLRNLGSQLPSWLEANPEFAGRRHRLALDVVRIEWAFVEAFDNAEHEPLTLEQIATLDGNSRLGLQPHLRLLALDHAADDLVLALHEREKRGTSEAGQQRDEAEDADGPARFGRLRRKPTWVAAHRVDNSVYYRRLIREEFRTLAALEQGKPLGETLMAGFAGSRVAARRQTELVREWFGHWAELGWICAPDLEGLFTEGEKER